MRVCGLSAVNEYVLWLLATAAGPVADLFQLAAAAVGACTLVSYIQASLRQP